MLGEVDAGDRERGGGQGDELAQALDALVMGGDDLDRSLQYEVLSVHHISVT